MAAGIRRHVLEPKSGSQAGVQILSVPGDPITQQLRLVDQLRLQLNQSSRQIHARVTRRQDVDLPADDVTDQHVMSDRIEAQTKRVVRALLEQRWELRRRRRALSTSSR